MPKLPPKKRVDRSPKKGPSKARNPRRAAKPVASVSANAEHKAPTNNRHSVNASNADPVSRNAKNGSIATNQKPYFVEVDEEHAGQRLDNFLITHLKGVPRSMIYRIIRKGELRVNKGRVKQTTRLTQGDLIRIPPLRQSDSKLLDLDGTKYSFLNKAVLFEDDAVLVLNKPSGMAVHAGSGVKVGVIEALRALRIDLNYIELVHRLDRETSGCLVLAKKSSALKILNADFKQNSLKNARLDKRYLTLLEGQWKGGLRRITKKLDTNARRAGERVVRVSEDGVYASSIFTPLQTSDFASLVEVKLLTGRTHQVRVHAQSEGHAVAGDQKYGGRAFNQASKKMGLSRLFLHAASIEFYHPVSETKVTINAPLPPELNAVLRALGSEFENYKTERRA